MLLYVGSWGCTGHLKMFSELPAWSGHCWLPTLSLHSHLCFFLGKPRDGEGSTCSHAHSGSCSTPTPRMDPNSEVRLVSNCPQWWLHKAGPQVWAHQHSTLFRRLWPILQVCYILSCSRETQRKDAKAQGRDHLSWKQMRESVFQVCWQPFGDTLFQKKMDSQASHREIELLPWCLIPGGWVHH